jgi:hypothetical protein
MQAHCTAIGSIKLGPLLLTLPTRLLTGQQTVAPGNRSALTQ